MPADPPFSQDLLLVWEEYRRAAKRSRQLKQQVSSYRSYNLLLIVVAAISGALASQIDTWGLPVDLSTALTVTSAIALSVAAFLSRYFLDYQSEKKWLVARSQAEALKSQAYIYLVQSPPYNGPDRDEKLSSKMQEILGEFVVEPVSLTDNEKTEKLPQYLLSMEDYLQQRVKGQIETYFEAKVMECRRKLKLLKSISFLLGLSSAVLGGLSAADIGWSAAWVPFIGNISGALAVFTFSGRYDYLMTSYTLAVRRLKWTHNAWYRLSEQERSEQFGTFVHKFEDVLSIENKSWVVEGTNKDDEKTVDSSF